MGAWSEGETSRLHAPSSPTPKGCCGSTRAQRHIVPAVRWSHCRWRERLFEIARPLEIYRHAGEQVPTKRVVDLREGVAVRTKCSDRRLSIEDVVRTEAEVELVRNPRGH